MVPKLFDCQRVLRLMIFLNTPYCRNLAIKSKLAIRFLQNFDTTDIKPNAIHMRNLNEIE